MPTCSNCLALTERIRRLEADEDAHLEQIAALGARLARSEAKLARSQALCRRLASNVAALGGLLSGRVALGDLLGAA